MEDTVLQQGTYTKYDDWHVLRYGLTFPWLLTWGAICFIFLKTKIMERIVRDGELHDNNPFFFFKREWGVLVNTPEYILGLFRNIPSSADPCLIDRVSGNARWMQTGRTREQTMLLLSAGHQFAGPDVPWFPNQDEQPHSLVGIPVQQKHCKTQWLNGIATIRWLILGSSSFKAPVP